jgi:hypothetical protein
MDLTQTIGELASRGGAGGSLVCAAHFNAYAVMSAEAIGYYLVISHSATP